MKPPWLALSLCCTLVTLAHVLTKYDKPVYDVLCVLGFAGYARA